MRDGNARLRNIYLVLNIVGCALCVYVGFNIYWRAGDLEDTDIDRIEQVLDGRDAWEAAGMVQHPRLPVFGGERGDITVSKTRLFAATKLFLQAHGAAPDQPRYAYRLAEISVASLAPWDPMTELVPDHSQGIAELMKWSREVTRLDPDNAMGHYMLALAQFADGDDAAAFDTLTHAHTLPRADAYPLPLTSAAVLDGVWYEPGSRCSAPTIWAAECLTRCLIAAALRKDASGQADEAAAILHDAVIVARRGVLQQVTGRNGLQNADRVITALQKAVQSHPADTILNADIADFATAFEGMDDSWRGYYRAYAVEYAGAISRWRLFDDTAIVAVLQLVVFVPFAVFGFVAFRRPRSAGQPLPFFSYKPLVVGLGVGCVVVALMEWLSFEYAQQPWALRDWYNLRLMHGLQLLLLAVGCGVATLVGAHHFSRRSGLSAQEPVAHRARIYANFAMFASAFLMVALVLLVYGGAVSMGVAIHHGMPPLTPILDSWHQPPQISLAAFQRKYLPQWHAGEFVEPPAPAE